jgi:hypothetical protein
MPLKLVTSGALEKRMLTQSMPALDNRHHQAFPVLLESEAHRVRELRSAKVFPRWCSTAAPEAVKPALRRGSKIIFGFPMGTSGAALMARAYNQAHKFGVEIAIPDEVTSLETADDPAVDSFLLRLANGEVVRTRTVVIASGARYRRLAVDKLEEFESSSIRYWASPLEAKLCEGQEVILVGAGNSAGQATVYLATGRQRLGLSRAEAIFQRICLAISWIASKDCQTWKS